MEQNQVFCEKGDCPGVTLEIGSFYHLLRCSVNGKGSGFDPHFTMPLVRLLLLTLAELCEVAKLPAECEGLPGARLNDVTDFKRWLKFLADKAAQAGSMEEFAKELV
jgi:hypothetical protein